ARPPTRPPNGPPSPSAAGPGPRTSPGRPCSCSRTWPPSSRVRCCRSTVGRRPGPPSSTRTTCRCSSTTPASGPGSRAAPHLRSLRPVTAADTVLAHLGGFDEVLLPALAQAAPDVRFVPCPGDGTPPPEPGEVLVTLLNDKPRL